MNFLPKYGVYFVHIPKCGGISVQKALPADDTNQAALAADLSISTREASQLAQSHRYGEAPSMVGGKGYSHPHLGWINPVHLPLRFVKSDLPETWKVLEGAPHSFALIRDPRDRFLSALLQRMKEFSDAGAISVDDQIVADEAARVCDWLNARDDFCDMEYVHFTRQCDYVELDGTQVVKMVLPLKKTQAVSAWLQQSAGLSIEIPHTHIRRQPKKWAKSMQPVARGVARTLLPRQIKKALHPLWMNSGVFSDSAMAYRATDLGEDVEMFITSYYAKDAVLLALADENAAKFDHQIVTT